MSPKSNVALLAAASSLLMLLLAANSAECVPTYEGEGQSGGRYEDGGLGGLISGMAGGASGFGAGLTDMLGSLGGKQETKKGQYEGKQDSTDGLFGIKEPVDFIRLLFSPLELINKIAATFKLEKFEFVESLGKGLTFGIEVALQPALVSIKIIEKVFVPDMCKLKFICELGRPISVFKGTLPKFSTGFFDGANTVRAFSDGLSGRDCAVAYPCGGEPKLKKEYEALKQRPYGRGGYAGGSGGGKQPSGGEYGAGGGAGAGEYQSGGDQEQSYVGGK